MIAHLGLTTIKQISSNLSIQVNKDNFEFLVINHPKFDAAFALHGAHLVHFQIKGQAPLIYTSSNAIYSADKAIRGGVPICWPWFGSTVETKQKNLPSHGFARTSTWQLNDTSENEQGVDIEFLFASNSETKSIWNNDFQVTLRAQLTDQIKLTLVTKNTGVQGFTYRGALHSYLHIGDIKQFCVNGLASTYSDSLDHGVIKNTQQPAYQTGPIDAIFAVNEGDIVLEDKANQRNITILNQGNDSVVVWNPWEEGAKAFVDMPDDGYKTMFCVESAITAKQGVYVAPNQQHCLQTVIK